MWNNSAKLLIVRVKVNQRGFTFPVPVYVVDEFLKALTDLAWMGEMALKSVPLPRDAKARKQLRWVKAISPSGIIEALNSTIKELTRNKGLNVIDVETGDVQVKISLK